LVSFLSQLVTVCSGKGIVVSYKPFLRVEALIASTETVLGIGSCSDVEKVASKLDAKLIHTDKLILPGFVDAHLHIDALGFELSTTSLHGVKSRGELLEILRKAEPNIGDWIVLGRFDYLLFPDQKPPSRRELDEFAGNYPVLLIHRSGHMGVLNTLALKRVGRAISGGKVDFENGWVYESALWSVKNQVFNQLGASERARLIKKADEYLWRSGVTAAGVLGASKQLVESLVSIAGELKLRYYVYVHADAVSSLNEVLKYRVKTELLTPRIKICGVKVFADGALGPRTAYLSKPYSDDPGNRGVELATKSALEEIFREAGKLGLQVAVHAIGDAALDNVLEVMSKYRVETALLRYRIEHASLVRDDQLEKIRVLKPVVVVQPHFIITDKWVLERVGVERVKWLYRYKSLQEATITAYSTDAPVEPVNPWETIYAAVTRGAREGLKHGELTASETVSLIDALHAYTRAAGYALGDEKLGCLLPGCYPDMIAVDPDPFEIADTADLLRVKTTPLNMS